MTTPEKPSYLTLWDTLKTIESGHFPGASEMAVNGQWHDFATELQKIARAALALANEETE